MSEAATPYDRDFFNSIGTGSGRSARRLLPLVATALKPHSVLDVGCGRGVWLAEMMRLGVTDAMGVDGAYVTHETLVVPRGRFQARDVTRRFDLGRMFDLAICLEVGEHNAPAASATLVENTVSHAPMVLFSAAVPGQGGQDHINEAPLTFWRDLFEQQGFACFDPFRRQIAGMPDVEPWYKNTVLLDVRDDRIAAWPEAVRGTQIASGADIADMSSPLFRLRKLVLRNLPRPVVTAMARTKHRVRSALGSAH